MKKATDISAIIDNHYQIIKLIGSGGMGQVYEAFNFCTGGRVAIKTLHPQKIENMDAYRRFHHEAQTAGSIGHENVCEVTDVGTLENGAPYLVMPLLKGKSLGEMLRRHHLFNIETIIHIAIQTLSALHATHQKQIIHRDLKPDNIFLTQLNQEQYFVKLLDFGISKVIGASQNTVLTRTGNVAGTAHYMAPEQASGVKEIDHRVDIYAVGVILYESLTGHKPYNGDSYNEIIAGIISKPFPQPRLINPYIPQNVENIILKATARNPKDRYASAYSMRLLLDRCLKDIESGKVDLAEITDTSITAEHELPSEVHLRPAKPKSIFEKHGWKVVVLVIAAGTALFFQNQLTEEPNSALEISPQLLQELGQDPSISIKTATAQSLPSNKAMEPAQQTSSQETAPGLPQRPNYANKSADNNCDETAGAMTDHQYSEKQIPRSSINVQERQRRNIKVKPINTKTVRSKRKAMKRERKLIDGRFNTTFVTQF